MIWKCYRFSTASVEDYRPVIFDRRYPWWCSSESGDGTSAAITAYLPADEPLEKYWPDAAQVEMTEESAITFTPRFPRPAWYVEVTKSRQ